MVFASKSSSILLLFVCLGFCLSLQQANAMKVHFKNCPGYHPKSDKVSWDVSPCDKEPCVFHKGTNVTFTLSFVPTEVVKDSTDTKIELIALVGPFKKQFPLPNPMACKEHGLKCPLKPGVPVTLTSTAFVKRSVPTISFVGQFDMQDQHKKMVFCVQAKDRVQLGGEKEEQEEEP